MNTSDSILAAHERKTLAAAANPFDGRKLAANFKSRMEIAAIMDDRRRLQVNNWALAINAAAVAGLNLAQFTPCNSTAGMWFQDSLCVRCKCDETWREREEDSCVVLAAAGVFGESRDWYVSNERRPQPFCRWFDDGTRAPAIEPKPEPDGVPF